MPELPEVETIKRDLDKILVGRRITGIDFLWSGILKGYEPNDFGKIVIGKKVVSIIRRAKNLAIVLEDGVNLLFHMKMTGHLIYTDNCWEVDGSGKWIHREDKESPLYDPLNQFIRVIFHLDNGKILAFSDLRKFAYVKLLDEAGLKEALGGYGPEPLSTDFNLKYLTEAFAKKRVAIKKVLMDQKIIAGIGNIYADEILWATKIHPLTKASELSAAEIESLIAETVRILRKSITLKGTSTSDFRDTSGKKGGYGNELRVYKRNGLPCERDGFPISRIVVGGRGTHFCPKCQKEVE